ncbi:MAG TPA: T9SS type A sorting domain-containing protein, partial [Chitinophagales bacterium]|nr:T9SS type A sorting domain-containing protein [Chitinophagales bacterium]
AIITIIPKPQANAGEDKILCAGETVELTATGGAGYAWSTGDVTATISASEPGSYAVTVTATNGCAASDEVRVVESLVLTGSITGNADVEAGSNEHYSVNDNTGSVYHWQVSNGTIVAGQGSAAVEVTWGVVGTGSLSVVETNADACTGETVALQVNVGPTSIAAVNSNESMKIFSNPSSSWVKVAFANDAGTTYRLSLYDVNGKVVNTLSGITGSEAIFSTDKLPPGVYFAELKGGRVLTGKVIVAQ